MAKKGQVMAKKGQVPDPTVMKFVLIPVRGFLALVFFGIAITTTAQYVIRIRSIVCRY